VGPELVAKNTLAMNLPVRVVIDTGGPDPAQTGTATTGAGTLVGSGPFDGMSSQDAATAITAHLSERGLG
jgi:leucyl-tRNA synthetase